LLVLASVLVGCPWWHHHGHHSGPITTMVQDEGAIKFPTIFSNFNKY
jgi:hypothetical protein